MEMKTQLFTIFMTVGPSNCGKTSFLKNHLSPALSQLTKTPTQIVHLSSDEIRQQVLGYAADKLDVRMSHASEAAFDLLLTRLKVSTTYPINAHFVFVDTTGFNEDFRNKVQEIAQKNNYHCELLIFDYKDTLSYFEGIESNPQHKRVTNQHLTRMRQEVFQSLKKKSYKNSTTFKERPTGSLSVVIEDLDNLERNILPAGTYTFVGDTHGMKDSFLELLEKMGVTVKENIITYVPEKLGKLILLGDYLDKGKDSGSLLDFIYENRSHFLIIRANHEHFVFQEMIKPSPLDEEFKKEYFNSFYELTESQKQRLKDLYSQSFDFLQGPGFICSHAPCEMKFLGKTDKLSVKLQRKTPFDPKKKQASTVEEYVAAMEQGLSYLKTEAHKYHPLHIFGHQAFPQVFKEKNKVGIDTGAVHGGRLTALTLDAQGRMNFTSIATEEVKKFSAFGLVGPFMAQNKKEEKQYNLSSFDEDRMAKLASEKVGFISGTISPADKKSEELESMEEALEYYRPHMDSVELQIKHMGSRCNIYLRRNIEDCRAVSRNGFLIKQDLSSVFSALLSTHEESMKKNQWKMMLFDGELMPWSFLGKGLIEEQFKSLGTALQGEMNALSSSGFQEALKSLKSHEKMDSFKKQKHNTSPKVLAKEFGSTLLRSLEAVENFNLDLDQESKAVKSYNEQVSLYGKEEAVNFIPFALLKVVKESGSEEVFLQENILTKDNYSLAGGTQSLTLEFNDPDYLVKAKDFFKKASEAGEEGVVVKPKFTFMPKLAPMLKVRNPEYLRLIYGFDYQHPENLAKLRDKKSVKKKRQISQREYSLGKKLLEIPEDQLKVDNELFRSLIAAFISEESLEQSLDKRL